MKTIPEIKIKDLAVKPHSDYANFEGENRIFIIFQTVSPEMRKLKEGNEFFYKKELYRIAIKTSNTENFPESSLFKCLKVGKSAA